MSDDLLAAGLSPEPLEDQRGADLVGGDDGHLPFGMRREQQHGLSEASARDQEGVELSGLLQLIKSSQGGDDPLFGSSVDPAVLDDLEVRACAGVLSAEEHSALVVRTP